MPDGVTTALVPAPSTSEIFQRLRTDLLYYGPRCLTIRPKKGAPERIRWNRAQLYLHEKLEEQRKTTGRVRAIILKYRQGGITTYVQARFYWKCTGTSGARAFILTHEGQATENVFGITKRYHENCPEELKPHADRDSNRELNFDILDSGYKVATAGTKGTGRSQTIQLFHGSECGYWPNADEHVAGVMQAIPDEDGTEAILESTANGVGDTFHEMWQQAIAGLSPYIAIFLPWFWQDEYHADVPEGFELTPDEIDYKDTYQLSNRQMAWRRLKISEFKGDGSRFKREYPADPIEAFEESGAESYIPPAWVRRARKAECEAIGPVVFGVDVARKGDDRSVISIRQGRKILRRDVLAKRDTMQVVGAVCAAMKEMLPDRVFIDVIGIGAGVVDRLAQLMDTDEWRALGFDPEVIVGVNASESAMDAEQYGNKRAECYGRMREWYEHGPVDIPDEDTAHADIVACGYYYDAHNRYMIEKKENVKKRLKRSPDIGDADALTHAEPVRKRNRQNKAANTRGVGSESAYGWMG